MLIRCVWDKICVPLRRIGGGKGALLVTRRLVGALLIVGGLGLLTGGSASARSFAGFNGRIAFQSRVDGKDEIFLMDPDGSNITRLTNTPAHNNGCPAWSPDGSRIAFSSDRDGAQVNAFDTYDIYVMAADGSSVTRLTNTPGMTTPARAGHRTAPCWCSPATETAPRRRTRILPRSIGWALMARTKRGSLTTKR
jgi:Tol biopolymer transport system component